MAAAISVRPIFPNEPLESMLKRLKRKIKNDGRIIEMRKHEFFERPGEVRRQKRRRNKSIIGGTLNGDES